jgi:hypothetical protein
MEKVKKFLSAICCLSLLIYCACEKNVLFDFEEQLELELAEIDHFLQRNDIPVEILENHARLNVEIEGNGIVPQDWDTVNYYYSLYGLDSTLIQSNRPEFAAIAGQLNRYVSDTLSFIVYPDKLNDRGFFSLGIGLSQEKSLVQLFLPSYLAFGRRGGVNIPPDTPVMVEFEILEIVR